MKTVRNNVWNINPFPLIQPNICHLIFNFWSQSRTFEVLVSEDQSGLRLKRARSRVCCLYVLRECCSELAKPLFLIYRKSLDSGELPQDWKTATVTQFSRRGAEPKRGTTGL